MRHRYDRPARSGSPLSSAPCIEVEITGKPYFWRGNLLGVGRRMTVTEREAERLVRSGFARRVSPGPEVVSTPAPEVATVPLPASSGASSPDIVVWPASMAEIAPERLADGIADDDAAGAWVCDECGRRYKGRLPLARHKQLEHGAVPNRARGGE